MNRFIIVSASLLFVALMTSCNQVNKEGKSEETFSVENMGRTISLDKNIKDVVVFDVGAMENMIELDIPFKGMAKQYAPNFLDSYIKDDKITDVGYFIQPNYEQVSKLNPDLIIMSNWYDKDYSEFSKIAPTISVGIAGSDYMSSAIRDLKTLGQVFHVESKVDSLISQLENKVTAVKETIASSDETAMLILYNNRNLSVFGKESRFGFIFKELGVKSAMGDIKEGSDHGSIVSSEFVMEQNPDIIYIIDRGLVMDNTPLNKEELENPLIQKTNAYKNGKIVYLDPNIWYLAGGGYTSFNKMLDGVLEAYN
ncbi:siderophore ABC transporter substrate-binding protein [Myroides pelagicus]|uniref:ABC transporter substrate-binding protein n=1 Tax=Myroides pelagicus TaxID=270914 RepID=A0A7K1GLC0_9FLAO|nr:ABC transporter substrate-binding protein [Myroides pelagicus]MEC4112758.1 ABC transporter substrate-binding protein [Myroides pelagicus]MTH29651.1 ABC transporter substrate-binding protein [Myroides pelagicus]